MEAGEMVQTICRDGGSCVVVDEASAMTVKAIGPDGPSLAARERGAGVDLNEFGLTPVEHGDHQ
jgi:hypothetical protein